MDFIPFRVILIIFEKIKLITDKRQFLRTCKKHNILTKKSMKKFEDNYKIKDFDKITDYCVDKFMLELSHDKYFDMIPNHYLIEENEILLKSSAYFGNLLLLDKLRTIFTIGKYNLNFIARIASLSGQLEVLQWVLKTDFDFFALSVCINAAQNGHLHILKWLYENGYLESNVFYYALWGGHLSILEWIKEIDYISPAFCWCISWNYKDTCSIAAINGYLDILQWAHKNGCYWDAKTCSSAARYGYLECLQYAHENGCEWDAKTCSEAASGGHLECLKYARLNGCEWNNKVYLNAKKSKHWTLLKWTIDNNCPV